jgi:hypothetical protein
VAPVWNHTLQLSLASALECREQERFAVAPGLRFVVASLVDRRLGDISTVVATD